MLDYAGLCWIVGFSKVPKLSAFESTITVEDTKKLQLRRVNPVQPRKREYNADGTYNGIEKSVQGTINPIRVLREGHCQNMTNCY